MQTWVSASSSRGSGGSRSRSGGSHTISPSSSNAGSGRNALLTMPHPDRNRRCGDDDVQVATEHDQASGQRSLPNRRKPSAVAPGRRPANGSDASASTSSTVLLAGPEESVAGPEESVALLNSNSTRSGDSTRAGSSGSGHAPRLPSASYNSRGLLSESDETLVTPFNASAWKRMLRGYPDPALQARVLIGLSAGVDVQYRGPRDVSRPYVRNLPTALAHPAAVEADLAADIKLGRRAGPFKEPPLDHFIASPLGAVVKPGSDKIRIIHHLSYPFRGESVNKYVNHLACTLASFDDAARLLVMNGRGAMMSKIDVQAAYRCIPVRPADRGLIGIIWKDEYYFDKVLPFGLGSSCALWEDFADALEWNYKAPRSDSIHHSLYRRYLYRLTPQLPVCAAAATAGVVDLQDPRRTCLVTQACWPVHRVGVPRHTAELRPDDGTAQRHTNDHDQDRARYVAHT